MDSFKEQIVKKLPTQRDSMTKLFAMIASVALAFALVFIIYAFIPKYIILGIFLAVLALYGGFYLIQNLNVEYEYIFTNGEMDIDKIIAQRTRKRLVTVKFNTITAIGIADDNFSVDDGRTLVYASACDEDANDYYIDFQHKSLGNSTLVFTPDEDMLRMMKPYIPRTLRNSVNIPDKVSLEKDIEEQ